MAQRIRGQEVRVWLITSDTPELVVGDVRSFSVTPKFSKLEEQYLGDPSKRYDEIFDGVDFDMEMHIENANALRFVSLIRKRAIDRTSKTYVNIQAKLQFPDGSTPVVSLNNCFFENMPLNAGSRSDYVTFKLSGSCNDIDVLGIV